MCEERLSTASGCEQAAAEAASLRASLAAERAAAEALGASLAEEERGVGAGRRLVTAAPLRAGVALAEEEGMRRGAEGEAAAAGSALQVAEPSSHSLPIRVPQFITR